MDTSQNANCCLPLSSPVVLTVPPVPSATRGERCCLDGLGGRLNNGKAILAYGSGKHAVLRTLDEEPLLPNLGDRYTLSALIYRAHAYPVTSVKISASGTYVASGDERGNIRVWSFDNEEHLTRFERAILTGPIRDFGWDGESKRLTVVGERANGDAQSESARVIMSDVGTSLGQLSQHIRGRIASVAFKPNRPYRIVTAGREDTRCNFHKGPPFSKIPVSEGIPAEVAHTKGAVYCVRYSNKGALIASVSTDKSICIYEGKTMELKVKINNAHKATIYSCAWSGDDKFLLTASGDGTCKLISVSEDGTTAEEVRQWKPAEAQLGQPITKDFAPAGGGQLGCTFVNGNMPVSVGLNGQISILPMAGGDDEIKVLTGHYAACEAFSVDSGNGKFYTGDTDGIIVKWDLKTCQPIARILPAENNSDMMYVVHKGAISGLACTGEGSLLSVGWDDKLFCSEASAGRAGLNPTALGAQPSAIFTGTNLGAVATVQGIVLVDKNGKALSEIISIPYATQAICITSDDKTVFVGGDDCKIHIYDVIDGGSSLKEKHVIENGHLKGVTCMALSNDETKLASGDARDVCVFDLKNEYKPIIGRGRWCFHVQRVSCLCWSADDQILASGGADDSIYLWHVDKRSKRIHYPHAHRGGLTGLHFLNGDKSSGGSLKLLSVGIDSVVNQWDVTKDVAAKFK